VRFLNERPTTDLTYSDVFMVPNRSDVASRLDVDLTSTDGLATPLPLVAANMTAVSGRRMAETMARRGGLAIFPQDIPVEVVAQSIAKVKQSHPVFDTAVTAAPSWDARRSDGSRFTKQPLRVVMGRREIPESYRIRGLAAEGPYDPDPDRFLQVFTHDPFELLSTLYDRGVRHLMIEGGPGMVGLFAGEDLVDEMIWYRAPLLLGHGKSAVYRLSTGTLANAPRLHLDDLGMFPAVRVLGADTATHLVPVPRGDYQNPGARRVLERCTECYAPEPREDG